MKLFLFFSGPFFSWRYSLLDIFEEKYNFRKMGVKVKADVTEGPEKLAEAIGDDLEAVVCATGFRPGWDLLAPWKVS